MSRVVASIALVAFIAVGCATNQTVQLSPDTYLIRKEDARGIFGSMAKLKADVIRQANEFAAKQGKIAVPITMQEKPVGFGPGQWAWVEYQFRVVDKDDPEAQRTALLPRPDIVVDRTDRLTVDNQTPPAVDNNTSPATQGSAQVSIDSSVPNADVYVDGSFVGNTPLPNYRLVAGMHVIEVRAAGYQPWKRELSVAPDATSRVVAQLERQPQ
jgi:hypothetical protein